MALANTTPHSSAYSIANTLPAEIIRGTIRSAGGTTAAPLTGVEFFDRYQGKGIAAGSVSVSVRLTFQAADRTLTDARVAPGKSRGGARGN